MHQTFEEIMIRIDQLIDEAHSQMQFESMKPEAMDECLSLIVSLLQNNTVSENELHLMFQMMTCETEMKV